MNKKGFSLIELIAVIAIISTILAIAVPNYHDWQVKSSVEKQMKEMKADMDSTRLAAIQQKQEEGVVMAANSYTIKVYSSPDDPDDAGTVVSVKNVSYPIQTDGGVIRFDVRGLLRGANQNVWTTAAPDAAFDSLNISTARTDLAKR
jgi:prepilin-type N-terminal cleavage/methylation domain-containing protein